MKKYIFLLFLLLAFKSIGQNIPVTVQGKSLPQVAEKFDLSDDDVTIFAENNSWRKIKSKNAKKYYAPYVAINSLAYLPTPAGNTLNLNVIFTSSIDGKKYYIDPRGNATELSTSSGGKTYTAGNNITITNGNTINATSPAQVNSDWTSASGASQILNKPTIPAAQVNSDWTSASGPSQILNKPTIPAAQVNSDWTSTNGASQILNKPTIPAAQVNSDWTSTSGASQILNKPTIPAAQVNSDWTSTNGASQILNKPTIPAAQVNSDWTSASGASQILNKPISLPPSGNASGDLAGTYPNPTIAQKNALQGQVLKWDTSNGWMPENDNGLGSISGSQGITTVGTDIQVGGTITNTRTTSMGNNGRLLYNNILPSDLSPSHRTFFETLTLESPQPTWQLAGDIHNFGIGINGVNNKLKIGSGDFGYITSENGLEITTSRMLPNQNFNGIENSSITLSPAPTSLTSTALDFIFLETGGNYDNGSSVISLNATSQQSGVTYNMNNNSTGGSEHLWKIEIGDGNSTEMSLKELRLFLPNYIYRYDSGTPDDFLSISDIDGAVESHSLSKIPNIYSSNGVLNSNRIINADGKSFELNNSSDIILNATNNISLNSANELEITAPNITLGNLLPVITTTSNTFDCLVRDSLAFGKLKTQKVTVPTVPIVLNYQVTNYGVNATQGGEIYRVHIPNYLAGKKIKSITAFGNVTNQSVVVPFDIKENSASINSLSVPLGASNNSPTWAKNNYTFTSSLPTIGNFTTISVVNVQSGVDGQGNSFNGQISHLSFSVLII